MTTPQQTQSSKTSPAWSPQADSASFARSDGCFAMKRQHEDGSPKMRLSLRCPDTISAEISQLGTWTPRRRQCR